MSPSRSTGIGCGSAEEGEDIGVDSIENRQAQPEKVDEHIMYIRNVPS